MVCKFWGLPVTRFTCSCVGYNYSLDGNSEQVAGLTGRAQGSRRVSALS